MLELADCLKPCPEYPNNTPRIHTDKVDFTCEYQNWGLRGIVSIYIPKERLVDFFTHCVKSGITDSFDTEIRSTRWNNPHITFNPSNRISPEIQNTLFKLLDYLYSCNYNIHWVEGNYCYTIDSNGIILETIKIEGCD